jgi:hypothetical protein
MPDRLRIVVTGLAATYPFGGVFWDYVQYVLGFRRLGHEVLYLEDTGRWCYDPRTGTFVEAGAANAVLLNRHLGALDPDLERDWFFRDAAGATYGRPWAEVSEFCRTANLFLHISASCLLRDEYREADRIAFVDSDPLYTQAGILCDPEGAGAERTGWWRERHDVFFTFGENVGAPDCLIPTGTFDWIPTRQPVVLDCFDPAAVPVADRRRVLTTVASWEPTEKGPVVGGVAYKGKSAEFERFIDLPGRVGLPLEVALSGPAPRERLRGHGWQIREGFGVSADPWVYRDYLARSLAEWSVAKNAYVRSRSGWFSCRTACYLALGVPAVVQDTGFSRFLPTGEGLSAFDTVEEATAAIARIAADPDRNAAAARRIAEEFFDSDRVLTRLLDHAGRSAPTHGSAT